MQQTDHFRICPGRKNGLFRVKRKVMGQKMKSPQKPIHRTPRTVMGQKTMLFPFTRPARVREKRLNAAWKIYESEPFHC